MDQKGIFKIFTNKSQSLNISEPIGMAYVNDNFEDDEVELKIIERKLSLRNGPKLLIDERNPAVRVIQGQKSYGNVKILQNFNMNVPQGSIYGLLGASGCGKTTLLSCVVGLRNLDEGEITLFGRNNENNSMLREIGYMPQELALFGEFNIEETMNYFGRLYNLEKENIQEKMDSMLSLLHLSDSKKKISTLSGGQQRRVSLAVALLHEPKLLILDEPTVGMDAILRQCIMDHLREITRNRSTTVIITTHYVDEVKLADKIGILRNGRLLVERSPEWLMDKYRCDMEGVVLRLTLQDERLISTSSMKRASFTNNIQTGINQEELDNYREKQNTHFKNEKIKIRETKKNIYNVLTALIIKNIICLWRNILFVAFVFLLPALQTLCICYAIGGDLTNLKLGIINDEFEDIYNCTPKVGGECPKFSENLACQYLNYLKEEKILFEVLMTKEEAINKIDLNHLHGFIHFGHNYSRHTIDRTIAGNFATNESVNGAKIVTRLDMTNELIGFAIKRRMYDAFKKYAKDITDCYLDYDTLDSPIFFDTPVFGSEDPHFTHYVSSGVLLGLVFFIAVSLTGQLLINEKKGGMLERSFIAGVNYYEVIASHFLSQFMINVVQIIMCFLIIIFVFETPFEGNIFQIVSIAILQGITGMFLGFVITVICKDESQVMQLTIGITLPNFVVSGFLWPLESMPKIMAAVVKLFPQTLAAQSLRMMLLRGLTFSHSEVWPGFLVTFLWIAAFIIILVLSVVFKRI